MPDWKPRLCKQYQWIVADPELLGGPVQLQLAAVAQGWRDDAVTGQ